MIGTIKSDTDAERFSDYLLAQGMENQLEQPASGEEWQVWVEHDDHLDRAKAEMQAYLRNPADTRYDAAAGHAEKIRKEEEKKQKRLRKQFVDVRTRWGQPKQWAAALTLILIALSCVISVGTNSIGLFGERKEPAIDPFRFASIQEARIDAFADRHPDIETRYEFFIRYWLSDMQRGQAWRLFTPMFLHWNILHLLFNMFWLRDLGGMIEVQRGTWRLALIVVLCSIFPFILQNAVSGPGFGGMSGVVYGLFGYVWIKGRYEPHLGLGISQQGAMIMMVWLVICMTGLVGPVANTAHVAGLVIGAAMAYAPIAQRRVRRRLE